MAIGNFRRLKRPIQTMPTAKISVLGTYLGVMNQDVWFSYEACGSGELVVSTCNFVDFDTDL